jgi:hypothetical protein
MRKGVLRRLFVFFVGMFLSLGVLLGSASGQPGQYGQPSAPQDSIAADQRPWKGFPWLIGVGLMAITLMVSFKDAKKTHLD